MKKLYLLKSMLLLCALVVGSNVWADDKLAYTFATAKSSSNTAYASNYDVTISGMVWSVPGNQNFDGYVRIGGKSLDNVNRVITGKNAMSSAIKKITLNHKGKSNNNLTINSISVTVASDASFNTIIETKTVNSPSIATSTSGSIDFTPTASSWAANSYYKFTINVSNSINTNYGFDVASIAFYEADSKPATPTFDPAEGEFYEAFTLHLGCVTDGVTMYYTTDGNVPTTSSTEYDDATGIAIPASTTTVKAIAVKSDMESDVASATYTFKTVRKPTFSPASGTELYYGDAVVITCSTDDSDIYYTTNGDEPTTSSIKYTAPVAINDDVTLKAIAVKGSDESSVASASYTLKTPDAPEFNVAEGAVESGTVLTITSRAGTTLYYTTDGSDPDKAEDSKTNSVNVTINAAMTVRAIAVDGALNISSETSANYVLYTDPDFSVADMTLEIGEQKTPTVTTNSTGTVSFESKNSAIATIVDGKVKAVAKGTATITASITASGSFRAKSVDFTVRVVPVPIWENSNKGIDVLTWSALGLSNGSGYQEIEDKPISSSAKYSGKVASNQGKSLQLNNTNPYGIVTTFTGGKVRKITVSWYSNASQRYLDIYGKNDKAYTSGADLYSTSTQGDLIGSFDNQSDVQTLIISGDYQYVGFRSRSGALYPANITIYWEGESVSLSDASDYTPEAKDYAKVTLNREFQEGWNGVVLPFDFTTDVKTALGASEVKTLHSATEESGAVTLNFTNASLPVAAGTPVLVKCGADLASGEVVINGAEIKTTDPTTTVVTKSVAGNTFTLTGTYSETDLKNSEAYFVARYKFYHKAAGVTLTAAPFRSYIVQTVTSGARKEVNFNLEGSEANGIADINRETMANDRYYDLQGRSVAKPTKGLYIVNGKKTLVN